jgi:AcrR family transcriptional regulator
MSKKDPDRVREELINQGIKLFLAKGYAGSTTTELVRRAGVSNGALYWHFKDKDDILDSIIDRYESQFIGGLIARVNDCPGDFIAKVAAFDRFSAEFARHNRDLLLVFTSLIVEFSGSGTRIEERMKAVQDRYAVTIQKLLEDGIKDGTVGEEIDPLTHSRFIIGAMIGSLIMWHLHSEEYKKDRDLSRRQAIMQRDALVKVVSSRQSLSLVREP